MGVLEGTIEGWVDMSWYAYLIDVARWRRRRGGDVRHESYAYLLPLFVLIRDSPKMIPIRG
jgi:hypothetical protein